MGSGAWSKAFAGAYDAAFTLAERRGFADVRSEVVGRAAGRVLEVGAGTGLNFRHYSGTVEDLLLTEPDPHMAARLHRRVRARPGPVPVKVVQAPAERLPVDDASVDAVVCTLVLCTTADPEAALAEIARVLRPGGSVSFAEHVRAGSAQLARWQDRLNRPWGWCAGGCNCNRDTVSLIRSSPLRLDQVRSGELRGLVPLVRPLVVGVASKEG